MTESIYDRISEKGVQPDLRFPGNVMLPCRILLPLVLFSHRFNRVCT